MPAKKAGTALAIDASGRHGERREHVHREGGGSGEQHLGGEQRSYGHLLRTGGVPDWMLQGRLSA
jgi:hypothetical protein